MRFYVETDRLIMRDLLPTDAAGMFSLDSDPEVHKYIGGKPVRSIEESRDVIDIIRAQYISNGIGRWAVVEKATGLFIGWSGLKLMTKMINGHTNYYDLGYRFIKQYWGMGYATETALTSVQYAVNVLRSNDVYGMATINNMGSRNVLEKAGLQANGTFDHEDIEHVWYELKKDEAAV